MTRKDIRSALERAAGDAVDRDFAAQAWGRGRALRRRRQVGITTAGSLAVAAAAATAVFLGGVGQDTAQPPVDPAGTPVSTEAPTEGQGDERIADGTGRTQADDTVPSPDASTEAPQDSVVLVLTPGDGWSPSGELTTATTDSLTGGEWQLANPSAEWAPEAGAAGETAAFEFDGRTLTVSLCGSPVTIDVEVQDGHLVPTAPKDATEATAADGLCDPSPIGDAGFWLDLIRSEPLVGMDGDGLVIAHPSTLNEEVPASMEFTVDGSDAEQKGSLEPATPRDLNQTFVEVRDADGDLEPAVIDPDPASTMRWTGGESELRFLEPCFERYGQMWLLETSTESRLITMVGSGAETTCDPRQNEPSAFTFLILSIPTVQVDGPRLVLQGRVWDVFLGETAAQECSAASLGSPELQVGEADEVIEARAQRLLDAALACDSDLLIQLATQDQTALSLGITSPEETFGLPESSTQPYATMVELLTSGPPEEIANPADEFRGWVWSGPDGSSSEGFILAINPESAWTGFLALE